MTTPMNERDVAALVPGDIVMVRPYDEISPMLGVENNSNGQAYVYSILPREALGRVWMQQKLLKSCSGKRYRVSSIEKRNRSYFGTCLVLLEHIKSGRKINRAFVPEWLSKEVVDEEELSEAFSKLF